MMLCHDAGKKSGFFIGRFEVDRCVASWTRKGVMVASIGWGAGEGGGKPFDETAR